MSMTAISVPMIMPRVNSHGHVPNCRSPKKPRLIRPTVGTNIRHVVLAISPSNKMTVERSGGCGEVPVSLDDALIYRYTIPRNERPSKMPRRHKSTRHTPYAPTGCAKKRYPSKAAAIRAAELQELMHPHLDLSVYQCPSCASWHLTRQDRFS